MTSINPIEELTGKIPSGLFIVTTPPDEIGLSQAHLASWVMQISFSPLLISMAIKKDRPTYAPIIGTGFFGLSLISDQETQILRHFWKSYDSKTKENHPFYNGSIQWEEGHYKIPLLKESLGTLTCRLNEVISPKNSDHELFLSEIVEAKIFKNLSEQGPKIHLRKSALQY